MTTKYMRKCSTCLITKEVQVKMRFHLTPVKTHDHQENNNKCWQGCRGKGTLIHCWWECKLLRWKSAWRSLKNLKLKLPYDPVIPLLGIYLEACTCTPMFIKALFVIVKLWNQPRCPSTNE
jgi:hypothetical protein